MSGLLMEQINPYNCCPSSIIAANEDIFNGDPASDVISMENYDVVMFIITKNAGASGTATITVESCDDFTPSTATAIAFHYKVCTSGNTWGSTTAATSSGFTTTAGADQMYLIEVRSEDLVEGDVGVRLQCTEVANYACDGAIICIGFKGRYKMDVPPVLTS